MRQTGERENTYATFLQDLHQQGRRTDLDDDILTHLQLENDALVPN